MSRKYWNVQRVCAWALYWCAVVFAWFDAYAQTAACGAMGCFLLLAARDAEARDATR